MVGSQRLSSQPLNMQCALSSPYLGWSGRGARALARALVVAFFSELGQHHVSYFSLISFPVLGAADRVALDTPNYFTEQRCFVWHDALQKISLNYTCHAS